MLIIGESINSSIKRVGEAIKKRETSFLVKLAREQKEAGADIVDVHAGGLGHDEVEALRWAVQAIQAEVEIPIMLDSTNADAVEAALEVHRGHAIINSLSAEQSRWQQLLPLVAKYRCSTVVLCISEAGIPTIPEERLNVAQNMVEKGLQAGIRLQDLYVDPLVLSIGANWQAGKVTLETLRLIRKNIPEVQTICGVSNVSYGLPCRRLLNATFLSMAVALGLDACVIDVRDKVMMASIWAANALAGNDAYCSEYLKVYRAGQLQV